MSNKKRSTSKTPTKKSAQKHRATKHTLKDKLINEVKPYLYEHTSEMQQQYPNIASALLEAILQPQDNDINICSILSSCNNDELIDTTLKNFLPQKRHFLLQKLIDLLNSQQTPQKQTMILQWVLKLLQKYSEDILDKINTNELKLFIQQQRKKHPQNLQKIYGKISILG